MEMNRLLVAATASLLSMAAHAQVFRLTSDDVSTGVQVKDSQVLVGSGCSGGNRSPQLSWSGEPASTKSFAITMFDPDAPTGSGWWHWTVVNIPKDVHSLAPDAGNRSGLNLPKGAIQGRTDFGGPGYGGPCPPAGDKTHRYQFKVWAVKVDRLPIDSESSGALVGYLLNLNGAATAELVPVSTR
nr:kinase inhibitor [Rhizobacter sp. Root1221]